MRIFWYCFLVSFCVTLGLFILTSRRAKADDLDDAYQTCLPHKNDISPKMVVQDGRSVVDATAAHGPLFQPGWEHCLVIHRTWLQRNAAPVAALPADPTPVGPQSTIDLAKKLKDPKKPPPDAKLGD
jgi:hypothetical protein